MKLKTCISVLTLCASASIFASKNLHEAQPTASKKCFEAKSSNIAINWKAFKTPKKVGVAGSFTNFSLAKDLNGSSIEKALMGAKISIDSLKLSTKNKSRDKKISTNMFSTLKNKGAVIGEITKVSSSSFDLKITMNAVSKTYSFKYIVDGLQVKATGVIDVLDFSMNKELAALNKACFALHKGKTWSDVNVEILGQFIKANCK